MNMLIEIDDTEREAHAPFIRQDRGHTFLRFAQDPPVTETASATPKTTPILHALKMLGREPLSPQFVAERKLWVEKQLEPSWPFRRFGVWSLLCFIGIAGSLWGLEKASFVEAVQILVASPSLYAVVWAMGTGSVLLGSLMLLYASAAIGSRTSKLRQSEWERFTFDEYTVRFRIPEEVATIAKELQQHLPKVQLRVEALGFDPFLLASDGTSPEVYVACWGGDKVIRRYG